MTSGANNGGLMKKPARVSAISMLGLALLVSSMSELHAAELKILAGGSISGWLNELAPPFERTSGPKLVLHLHSTPHLTKQAVSGAPLDAAVVPVDLFKDSAANARF